MFNPNFPRCTSLALQDVGLCSSSLASPFCLVSALGVVGARQPGRSGGCQWRLKTKEIHIFQYNRHWVLLFLLLARVRLEVCSVPSSWVGDCRCPTARKWNLPWEEMSSWCPAGKPEFFCPFLKHLSYKYDLSTVSAEVGVVNTTSKWGLDLNASSVSSGGVVESYLSSVSLGNIYLHRCTSCWHSYFILAFCFVSLETTILAMSRLEFFCGMFNPGSMACLGPRGRKLSRNKYREGIVGM